MVGICCSDGSCMIPIGYVDNVMMWLVGNIRLYALLQGNLCLAEPCSDKSIIKVHEHIDSSTVGG